MALPDSTQRFSDRVDAYVKYRPDYPDELIELLKNEIGLSTSSTVADIGSGTGISSELFLRNGMTVYAVEPNEPMRVAAEQWLDTNPLFHSMHGTAEETTLQTESMDLILAGQAFHWFNREKAAKEFRRILKPGGHVVLFWNSRRTSGNAFLEDYEALLIRYGTDYNQINHQNVHDNDIADFFAPNPVKKHTLYNEQICDFTSLHGRVESSSYAPNRQHPDYEPMMAGLKDIYEAHQQNGTIRIEYDVVVYIGSFASST